MRYELSDLLEAAKADAPAPRYGVDDAVTAGRRLRNRRRTAWTSIVAAAAVVAVVASIAVPRLMLGEDRVAPPAETPAVSLPGDLTVTIKGYVAGRFTVTEAVQVSPGYQIAQIYGPRDESDSIVGAIARDRSTTLAFAPGWVVVPMGTVTVYRRGAFDPAAFTAGAEVPINGIPGRAVADAVAFPYADDAWAVVRTAESDLTQEELITVAAGLRFAPPRTPTVGFRLPKVPAGYALDSGGTAGHADGSFSLPKGSYLRLLKGEVSYTGLPDVVVDPQAAGADVRVIEVMVYPRGYAAENPSDDPSFCVAEENRCIRDSTDGKVQIQARGGRGTSTAELLDVVNGVVPADPDNPATWYPLTEAVG
jgi:hypothetical protein